MIKFEGFVVLYSEVNNLLKIDNIFPTLAQAQVYLENRKKIHPKNIYIVMKFYSMGEVEV